MDIYTLDLNFQNVPRAIASYLILAPGGPVLVETGPGATLPTLLEKMASHGLSPQDIRHVLVTHIHFDHAGAAGWWAQQGAQVYVHHIGARHLINPSRLIASASRIYGEMMDVLWGDILPAATDKITAVYDGDAIKVAGLTFTALDTPGHARHHHVFRLGDLAFTGDAAGIRLPGASFIDLPAPPPEFDLEVWQATLERLLQEKFAIIYPTHFGRVDDVHGQLEGFKQLVGDAAAFVHDRMQAGISRDDLVHEYTEWNRARGRAAGVSDEVIHQYETANPLYMSVDGMMRYWRKRDEQ
ncbi:MAG: MBL fold metallo-hydrolase [Anaerolineae bacterium]